MGLVQWVQMRLRTATAHTGSSSSSSHHSAVRQVSSTVTSQAHGLRIVQRQCTMPMRTHTMNKQMNAERQVAFNCGINQAVRVTVPIQH